MTNDQLFEKLAKFPRSKLARTPTALQPLSRLGEQLGLTLYVKRDDETGMSFGGNKVRQLEYYLGQAEAEGADTVLITGAVQSNFVRLTAAMAKQVNMHCHIQLEERVPNKNELYHTNGNVLLDRLLGATIHSFPEGENEAAADAALETQAESLRSQGHRPYIIHLGADHPPIGALGYVRAAIELSEQLVDIEPIDEIIIASGSALTHVGALFGLRALGHDIPVHGICVRRNHDAQTERVRKRIADLAELLSLPCPVADSDIRLFGGALAPGYGHMSEQTILAMKMAAQCEGLFLDPTYTGKVMAGLMMLAEAEQLAGKRILFWHTGGLAALFAYADQLTDYLISVEKPDQ